MIELPISLELVHARLWDPGTLFVVTFEPAPRQATVEIEVDVHLHQGSMTHFECPDGRSVRQREEPAGGDAAAFAVSAGLVCGEDQSPRRDPDAQRRSDDSLSDDGLTGLRMNLTSGADSHTLWHPNAREHRGCRDGIQHCRRDSTHLHRDG